MSDFQSIGQGMRDGKYSEFETEEFCPECAAPIIGFRIVLPRSISSGEPVVRKKECPCIVDSRARRLQEEADNVLRASRELLHAGYLKRFERTGITIPSVQHFAPKSIDRIGEKAEGIRHLGPFFEQVKTSGSAVGVPGFAMYGPNGVGKSHILYFLAEKLNDIRVTACVTTLIRVAAAFRDSFVNENESSSSSIIRDLASVPVLMIDDFGKEQIYNRGSGEFIQSAIFEIIDQRILRQLPVIVTSNKSFEELRDIRYKDTEWGRGLLDRIFELIGCESGRWAHFNSPYNYRTKRNEY